MIYKKTVFILGAGASQPYGYPTGATLRNEILKLHERESARVLFQRCGFDISNLVTFTEAFKKSGTTSIDAFLEYRPEFLKIGKTAITLILFEHEKEENLFEYNWYQYIFEKMNTSFDSFKENTVTFITFNYDRSLEHFFFSALKNKYNKSDDDVKAAVQAIPIIHLHGKIGALPWEGSPGRPYKALPMSVFKNDENAILTTEFSRDGIKIIHEEGLENSPEFIQANDSFEGADKIIFLGFGYHPTNIKRLAINKIDKEKTFHRIGTSYNFSTNERKQIQMQLLYNIFNLDLVNVKNLDVLNFLREHVVFE